MKLGLGVLLIALLGVSCKQEAPETVNTPAINITNKKLSPDPNESGTVRAYIGDEVTAEGFNLDKVGAVRFNGVDQIVLSFEQREHVAQTLAAVDLRVAEKPVDPVEPELSAVERRDRLADDQEDCLQDSRPEPSPGR